MSDMEDFVAVPCSRPRTLLLREPLLWHQVHMQVENHTEEEGGQICHCRMLSVYHKDALIPC